MRWTSLAVVGAFACGRSPPSPPAGHDDPPRAARSPCAGLDELRRWLAGLAADGSPPPQAQLDLRLARVDAFPSMESSHVAYLRLQPCLPPLECPSDDVLTSFSDRQLGEGDLADITPTAVAVAMRALYARQPGAGVELVIDERIAWGSIEPYVAAMARAGGHRVDLVFAAAKTHAAAPPPSTIDAELEARRAVDEADLARDPGGTLQRTLARRGPPDYVTAVYKDCPQALRLVDDIISERIASDDKLDAIAAQLPDAVAACGCRIELPALERLMWQLFGRDDNAALYTAFTVDVASDGAKFDAPRAATWSTVGAKLVEAARHGRPLAVE